MPPYSGLKVSLRCTARPEWNFVDRPAEKRMTWFQFLETNGVKVNTDDFRLSYQSNNRPVIQFHQTIEEFLQQFQRRKSSVNVKLIQLRSGGNGQRGRPPLDRMTSAPPPEHRPVIQNRPTLNGGVKRPQPQAVRIVHHTNTKAPRLEDRNYARPPQGQHDNDEEDSDDEDGNSSFQIPFQNRPDVPPMIPAVPSPRRQNGPGPMRFNFPRPTGMPPPRVAYQQPQRVDPLGGRPWMDARGHNDDNESLFSQATQDSQDIAEGVGETQARVINKLIRGINSSELIQISEEVKSLVGTERGMKMARYAPRAMHLLNNVFAL